MRAGGARVLCLTPNRARQLHEVHADTLSYLTLACAERGIALARERNSVPGLLPHARNELLARALEHESAPTHVFWWDADIGFEPDALLELLDRPEPLIARAYPLRHPSWDLARDRLADGASAQDLEPLTRHYGVRLHFEEGRPLWSADRELVDVEACGFGFVLIKMAALRNFVGWLAKKYPGCDRCGPLVVADWIGRRIVRAFDHRVTVPCGLQELPVVAGEDHSFLALWREWSGRVWLAPRRPITNAHVTGAYIDYLRAQFGEGAA